MNIRFLEIFKFNEKQKCFYLEGEEVFGDIVVIIKGLNLMLLLFLIDL